MSSPSLLHTYFILLPELFFWKWIWSLIMFIPSQKITCGCFDYEVSLKFSVPTLSTYPFSFIFIHFSLLCSTWYTVTSPCNSAHALPLLTMSFVLFYHKPTWMTYFLIYFHLTLTLLGSLSKWILSLLLHFLKSYTAFSVYLFPSLRYELLTDKDPMH